MGDLFEIFVFLAFVLVSLLGGRKKGKKPAPKKPPQRKPDAGRASRPAARRDESTAMPRSGRDGESAADMVPEDLWAVLTGEAPPSRFTPSSSSEEAMSEPRGREPSVPEMGGGREPQRAQQRTQEPAAPIAVDDEDRSLEEIRTPEYPVTVSLETPPAPSEARHDAFHAKLEARAARERRQAALRRRKRRAVRLRLGGRRNLQKAMVLREVLGPPKGLEM